MAIKNAPERRGRLAGLALALAITAAACGSSSPQVGGSRNATDAAAPVEALRFTAPLVGGGQFDGAAHNDRPVAFWFWAPT